jgi:hypothetical protein
MSDHICLCCLNAIDANQLVRENSHEYYHSCCYEILLETKRRRQNRLNTDIIDITDSLEIDYSDEPVYLNLKSNIDNNKSIGTFIDLSTNEKILDSYHNDIKNETINNILSGPEYATDIAGNLVKLDKQYLINYELKKLNIKL